MEESTVYSESPNISIDPNDQSDTNWIDTRQANSDFSPAAGEKLIELQSQISNSSFVDTSGLKCEDCSTTDVIRCWRWCRSCERVLCESCAVERHVNVGDGVEDYATAARRLNEEYRKVIDAAGRTVSKLEKSLENMQHVRVHIAKKTDEIKRFVNVAGNENEKSIEVFEQHLKDIGALASRPLNQQWLSDRGQLMAALGTLEEECKCLEAAFAKKLHDAENDANKFGTKLEEAFRGGDDKL